MWPSIAFETMKIELCQNQDNIGFDFGQGSFHFFYFF